jgi:hypothetical protein
MHPESTHKLQLHLKGPQAERALASMEGLAHDSAYSADLYGEIAAASHAYVAAAVSEIATLRAQLSGPQLG